MADQFARIERLLERANADPPVFISKSVGGWKRGVQTGPRQGMPPECPTGHGHYYGYNEAAGGWVNLTWDPATSDKTEVAKALLLAGADPDVLVQLFNADITRAAQEDVAALTKAAHHSEHQLREQDGRYRKTIWREAKTNYSRRELG